MFFFSVLIQVSRHGTGRRVESVVCEGAEEEEGETTEHVNVT